MKKEHTVSKPSSRSRRWAHRHSTKHSKKDAVLLGLLVASDVGKGEFYKIQALLRFIHDRRAKLTRQVEPFLYSCLKLVQQLQPGNEQSPWPQSPGNQYASLLAANHLCTLVGNTSWITGEHLSERSLRFTFYEYTGGEVKQGEKVSFKQLPYKIVDFKVFSGCPAVAVLNLGTRLLGLTISPRKSEQKQVLYFEMSEEIQAYVLQKDAIFILLKKGNILFGKIGQQLGYLESAQARFSELKTCGSDILVMSRSFVVKILNTSGNPKKVIRAGVAISNLLPIYTSNTMYVLMAEQQGKQCLLNCNRSGKNNQLQWCPEGLQAVQQALHLGRWVLLRTKTNKIYTFALTKQKPLQVYEIYNGMGPGMLQVLHHQLLVAG